MMKCIFLSNFFNISSGVLYDKTSELILKKSNRDKNTFAFMYSTYDMIAGPPLFKSNV